MRKCASCGKPVEENPLGPEEECFVCDAKANMTFRKVTYTNLTLEQAKATLLERGTLQVVFGSHSYDVTPAYSWNTEGNREVIGYEVEAVDGFLENEEGSTIFKSPEVAFKAIEEDPNR